MKSLKIGECLRLSSGETAKVQGLERNLGEFWVYNFEVQQYHNYYVTAHRSDPGVLVHNCCEESKSGGNGKPSSESIDANAEATVHRVTTPGQREFQLRKGEDGISVFDGKKVEPKEVLPHFRKESGVRTKTIKEIEAHGLRVKRTPGHENLPKHLRDSHMEIQKGPDMGRKQFKKALKKLEPGNG